MTVAHDVNLKPYNTMQLAVTAKQMAEVVRDAELLELANEPQLSALSWLALGGGSNVVLTKDIESLVVRMTNKGVSKVKETQDHVWFEVAAGEVWHEFVLNMVDQGYGGVENLALIPGTVGAAPVQNIAAYGQELADVLERVTYFDRITKEFVTSTTWELEFGYRDSQFKHDLKNRAIITKVLLRLSKNPQLETTYYSVGRRHDSVTQELEKVAQPPYSIKDVFNAVVSIRQRKLPDWTKVPTVGSFFKNPIITKKQLEQLQAQIHELQYYPVDNLSYRQANDPTFNTSDYVKVPAGKLLDELGWGQKRIGHVHTYNNWASVITHDGQATGLDIELYTKAMRADVLEHFGIELEAEVNVI